VVRSANCGVSEAPLYCAHLLRLDPESRRNRFAGTVSEAYIRAYAQPSNLADAVIHGFFIDGVLRGVAELRPLPEHEAEAALSVEKEWQGHDVGAALLERMLLATHNRGIELLHMTCLTENRRMRQLARKFNAELKFGFGSVVGKLKAPGSTLPRSCASLSPTAPALVTERQPDTCVRRHPLSDQAARTRQSQQATASGGLVND